MSEGRVVSFVDHPVERISMFMVWGKKEEEPRKFNNKRSTRQVMLTAFSDCCNLVYAEFGRNAHEE